MVWIEGNGRPEQDLADVGDACVDVAANVVWVVPLELRRGTGRAREDAVPEAWGESLDLRLDALGHVDV